MAKSKGKGKDREPKKAGGTDRPEEPKPFDRMTADPEEAAAWGRAFEGAATEPADPDRDDE
jgi:hypothetical protein